MVVADDRHRLAQPAELGDDACSLGRVGLHLRVLPVVELARLDQDPVRDGDLADVVEEGAEAERVQALRRELELLAQCERDPLHTERVAGRVRVLCLDGRIQALDRLQRALLEPAVRVEQRLRAFAQLARLAAERARGAAHQKGEGGPEREEHRRDRDPEEVPPRGERAFQVGRVRVDLVGADDLRLPVDRRVDLKQVVEPQ